MAKLEEAIEKLEEIMIKLERPAPATLFKRATRSVRELPLATWKGIALGTYRGINKKNLPLAAGGMTYYGLLAVFPALIAFVSIYGLMSSPAAVEAQLDALSHMLPGDAYRLASTEMHRIASASGSALSFGAVVGILAALWSASRGMSGLMSALDMAYGRTEGRGFFRFNVTAILLTLAALAAAVIGMALVVALPAYEAFLNIPDFLRWVTSVIEWLVLLLFLVSVLAVLYRFGPHRESPEWWWASPGAISAAVLWVAGSLIFRAYVVRFGNYNAVYGTLGGLVVILTWLYLVAFVIVLGAEINSEVERQLREI